MAVRGVDEKEDKKSYGTVFLLGAALLVVVTLWSFWDDNFTRRPWKAFQTAFYPLDYQKVKAAYAEEDKKLQADSNYQELTKKIAAEKQSLESGELAKKKAALQSELDKTLIEFGKLDQQSKFIKSELEEAYYEYDHAVHKKSARKNFDQPVARVDRCQTCHTAINRAGFEDAPQPFRTHPRRELLLADNAHPPEKFGCTSCHEGQGAAVNSVKAAHGEVDYWEHPLLRGAKVQSSCTACHLNMQPLEDAPQAAEGKRIFEQIGCTGCHLVKGYEDIPKIGPSLRRMSAKLDPSWTVRWVENPHKFRPRTRMPNFDFKENDAIAITAFLWSVSKDEGEKWLKDHPEPSGVGGNLAAQGKALVESIGCKGCHGFAEGEFTTTVGKQHDLVP